MEDPNESQALRIAPEKGSNPRVFQLSPKAVQMLNQLPRDHEHIFLGHYRNSYSLRRTFQKQRKRIAIKLGNPRINQIRFHTLRHWVGTMTYYKTKDILPTMQVLGRKRIQNTLKYTQLAKLPNKDDYVCKVAKSKEEIAPLVETGFEYVCTDQEGLKYYRKPK